MKCKIRSCKSCDRKKTVGIHFHRLPSNMTKLKIWAEKIGVPLRFIGMRDRICSKHFNESDYIEGLEQRKLKPDVVPSKELPESNSLKTSKPGVNIISKNNHDVRKARKQKQYEPSSLLAAIDCVRYEHESVREAARKFGVPRTTLQQRLKHGIKRKMKQKSSTFKMDFALLTIHEKIVYKWIKICQRMEFVLTSHVVRTFAERLSKIMQMCDFAADPGWYDYFSNRFKLTDIIKDSNSEEYLFNRVFQAVPICDVINAAKNELPEDLQTICQELELSKLIKKKTDTKINIETSTPKTYSRPVEKTDEIVSVQLKSENLEDYDQEMETPLISFCQSMNSGEDSLPIETEFVNANVQSTSHIEEEIMKDEFLENLEPAVISNYQEAIEYLKPLEDFALLKSNFRALNFISNLTEVFKMEIEPQ